MVSDEDPRLRAARYREGLDVETLAALAGRDVSGVTRPGRDTEEDADGAEDTDAGSSGDAESADPDRPRLLNNSVEVVARTAVDRAMAQGHFDHLAYAGKPLPDVVASTDPDWWTKSLMRREEIHADQGMGPEALLLRVADQNMETDLDALQRPHEVVAAVESFNRRVIEARRQLLGGPPVVTPTRDVEHELAAWRARRDERAGNGHDEGEQRRRAEQDGEAKPRRRGFFRRR